MRTSCVQRWVRNNQVLIGIARLSCAAASFFLLLLLQTLLDLCRARKVPLLLMLAPAAALTRRWGGGGEIEENQGQPMQSHTGDGFFRMQYSN